MLAEAVMDLHENKRGSNSSPQLVLWLVDKFDHEVELTYASRIVQSSHHRFFTMNIFTTNLRKSNIKEIEKVAMSMPMIASLWSCSPPCRG